MSAKKIPTVTEMKLTRSEYWEWMSSIQLMGRRKAEMELYQSESKVFQLEIQMKTLQMQLHNKTRLESGKGSVENATEDYQAIKNRIESRLGISLNDKIIDEITLEVKSVPENNPTKGI